MYTTGVKQDKSSQHPHLSAHYAVPDSDVDSIAVIAALLTRGPIENVGHFEQVKKIEDKDVLRSNAKYMHEVLSQESASLRHKIDADLGNVGGDREVRLLAAIDEGNEAGMQKFGLSFEYAWINDVVATIIRGKPPVEIETVGPYAAAHIDPATDRLEIEAAKIPSNEMAGILVASLLRKIDPVAHNTRIVSLMDELNNFTTSRTFTKDEQDKYVVAMSEFYQRQGVLNSDDVPGVDFIIIRESDLAGKVSELERCLKRSKQGIIETNGAGEVYFRPTIDLIDSLALHSKNRSDELRKMGVLLRQADGTPTCQAMDASGFLNPINEHFMHVVMLDKSMESQQDKVYALLKAMGTVKQERYHNIFFDAENLSPEIVAYGVCKTLELHTATFINALDKYDEWAAFDPYEYVKRNYGDKILEEDRQIIVTVIGALAGLGVQLGSLELVADIGSGPNLYPSMLMVPYIKNGAKIDMLEWSPANREYMTKLLAGQLAEDQAATWRKFEVFMRQQAGDIYEGCEANAKAAVNITEGNIFELPEAQYDLVSSYFVAESIVDSNMPFREAMQSLAKAIKPHGVLIVAHMVGSEGYYAGEGTLFPAVNLSVADLKEAYADADLDCTIVPVGENTSEKAREGYHGMAVVIARHRPVLA